MTTTSLDAVVRHVRLFATGDPGGEITDRQLLERFVTRQDEAAFGALVRRHGPLVLGACRRVLGDVHDADDAFQAVFLVLARKAHSIRGQATLASWLYVVARRVALKARGRAARRRARQEPVAEPAVADASVELTWREVQQVLDEELADLPVKFREPVLLCCFEGLSRDEAARRLGWTLGTVKGRLERGRERLRERLVRRGLTLGAALTALLLTEKTGRASPASSLVGPVLEAALGAASGRDAAGVLSSQAVALADSLAMPRLPSRAAALLVLGAAILGAGLLLMPASPLPADAPPAGQAPPAAKPAERAARTDSLGDPLPDGAFARLGTRRFRHELMVYSIAVSPDGKVIASTGAGSQAVKLWDAATGKELHSLPKRGDTLGVAFSPDGKTVVSTGTPASQMWDVASGRLLRQFEGHTNGVCCVAFSPDGRTLATGSYDTTIRLWDADTGKEVFQLQGHAAGVRGVVFLPGGKVIASASQDKTVRLWDLTTRREIAKMEGHTAEVWKLAVSPDGRRIASAGGDGTVRLWDAATFQEVHCWKDHKQSVEAVAFSPDGKVLASSGTDSVIRLWDVATGKPLRQIEGVPGRVPALAFTPDGKELVSGGMWDSALHFWDPATGKETRPHDAPIGLANTVRFLPDGKQLLTAYRDNTVRFWDWAEGKERSRFDSGERVAVSADGKVAAVAKFGSRSRQLIDLPTGKRTAEVDLPAWAGAVIISPDGKKVFLGQKESVMLWEPETGKEPRVLAQGPSTVGVVALSPDGKVLAGAGGYEGGQPAEHPVYLWDAATGKELLRLNGHTEYVSSIVFSPDGRLIATGAWDRTVRVWDTATGQEVHRFGEIKRWVSDVAFSPDGRYLAASNDSGEIVVWELASVGEVASFSGSQGETVGMAFSPDGTALASGGADCTVLIWDLTGIRTKDGWQGLTLRPAELEACFKALEGAEAKEAYHAGWKLVATKQAAAALKERLKPVKAVDPARVEQLIKDLDSEDFKVRASAVAALQAMAELAEPRLRKVLKESPSAEVKKQASQLLDRLEGPVLSPERLAMSRSLQVLVWIGTEEARQVLEGLAGGATEAWLTREAKASLGRLSPRSPK